MADMVTQRDIASVATPVLASAFTSITAGGAGDNAAIVGGTTDRTALNSYSSLPRAVEYAVAWQATLGANNTLSLKTAKIQSSQDGATWSDLQTFTDPGVVATGPAGGGVVSGVTKFGAQIGMAGRYVRFVVTPDLSAANTDTATVVSLGVMAGFDRLPAA